MLYPENHILSAILLEIFVHIR